MILDNLAQLDPMTVIGKATLLLSAAVAGRLLLRRSSAAFLHLVLTLGLAAVLILPVAVIALPGWNLSVPLARAETVMPLAASTWPPAAATPQAQPTQTAAPAVRTESTRGAEPLPAATAQPAHAATLFRLMPGDAGASRTSAIVEPTTVDRSTAIPWLALIWLAGLAAVSARVIGGWWRMQRLVTEAQSIESPVLREVLGDCAQRLGVRSMPRVVTHARVQIPMLWGVARPTLLLPSDWSTWSVDRLRVVLLHELAHQRRIDGLTLIVGKLATAIYWFHPIVWVAEKGARRDCERACDDLVLGCGTRPSDYAEHLLSIARGLPRPSLTPAAGLAILHKNQLEDRLRSILHPRVRRGLGYRAAITLVVLGLLTVVSVSSLRIVADEPESEPTFLLAQRAEPDEEVMKLRKEKEKYAKKRAREIKEKEKYREARGSNRSAFDHAYSLHSAEDFEAAVEAFKQAAEGGQRPATSMYNAACGYARLGNAEESVRWLERAFEAGFDHPEMAFEDSDFDPIRRDAGFRRMLERLRAEMPEDVRDSGKYSDRYDMALRAYELLEEDGVTDGDAWQKVGTWLLSLRELDRAQDALQRAVKDQEYNHTALYNLACAQALGGEERAALDSLERAVLAGFSSEERFRNDSDLAAVRGTSRFAEIAELSRALSLDGYHDEWHGDDDRHDDDSQDAHDAHGKGVGADRRARSWQTAVQRLQGFTSDRPEVGRGWHALGYALLQVERYDDARDAFAEALEQDFQPSKTMYNLACAHARAGRQTAALDWLARAVDEGFTDAWHMHEDKDLASVRDAARFEEIFERAAEAGDEKEMERRRWQRSLKRLR